MSNTYTRIFRYPVATPPTTLGTHDKSWKGPQVENSDEEHLITQWASDTAPTDLETPSSDNVITTILQDPGHSIAFDSPTTEICIITVKSPDLRTKWEEMMNTIFKAMSEVPTTRGGTWGHVIGNPDMYVMVVGWDSYEAHIALTKGEQAEQMIAYTDSLTDRVTTHARFIRE